MEIEGREGEALSRQSVVCLAVVGRMVDPLATAPFQPTPLYTCRHGPPVPFYPVMPSFDTGEMLVKR